MPDQQAFHEHLRALTRNAGRVVIETEPTERTSKLKVRSTTHLQMALRINQDVALASVVFAHATPFSGPRTALVFRGDSGN
jgi:hypothetical protein